MSGCAIPPDVLILGPVSDEGSEAMTPTEFKTIQHELGLTDTELCHILDTNERTLRKWKDEREERGPNPVAARVMIWMRDYDWTPPEWPARLLE